MRSISLLVILVTVTGFSSAQPAFEKEGRFVVSGTGPLPDRGAYRPVYEGPQPFDMLHYELDVRLAMLTPDLGGRMTMTMRLKRSVDSLVLHAVGLSLDTVLVDGVSKPIVLSPPTETFTILLGGSRAAGETLRVVIAYQRIPGFPRPNSRQGYYFFRDTIGLPTNLGYTFTEPSDSRFWMPCYDEPWEKATAELRITVPAGYVAASNGKLIGTTTNPGATVTWHWREQNQIATYLICMTVSGFTVSTLPYITPGNDTIPLQYYAWPADSADCAAYLPTVRQMMEVYAGLFGEYPFDKYGMTAIVPVAFLGMEHQTITTMNRYARTWERVVAHELAHQWWGDLVTCGTWPDIWLNESFATYSEALWKESAGGFPALKRYMKDTLEHFFFASWQGAIYDPVGQGFNLFDDVVYSKGAWVLHTLRGVLGDSTFFRVLAAYRARYAGLSAVTDELAAVVDSVAGTDMRWFFNQWIYGRGWPVYASSYTRDLDTLTLTIYQQQPPDRPVYKMPIRVRAYHGGGQTDFLVWDSLRVQTYHIPFALPPDSIILDPDGWILKQITQPPVSVASDGEPALFALDQNYPNPFNPTTSITFTLQKGQYASLLVYDLLGREVAVLVDGVLPMGRHAYRFDGEGLAGGTYFYRLTTGDGVSVRKMLLLR